MPYQRPPLSKAFLSDDKPITDFLLKPESIYEKADVKFRLNTSVTSINRSEKKITLDTGEILTYSKLALCTGAKANKIPLSNNNLKGVHYLRNADDAIAIKNEIKAEKNAVIVGGGFIGLEIAAVLTQKGMNVTILEAQNNILQRVVSPEISKYFTELHQSFGVTIETSIIADVLEGNDHVEAVRCQSGKLIPADLVIIGVGVTPEVLIAEQCQLTINNGISVNQYAVTSDPDIVAAGDCTNYYHELYQRDVRLESIQNALEQSKSAAASINGKNIPFNNNIPRFWSDQYDIKLQICGLFEGYEHIEIEQNLQERKLNALYFKNNKIIAAIAVNNPKFIAKSQIAIKSQETIQPSGFGDFFNV